MALPERSDLETMDFAYLAQPFVDVAGNSGIDTFTMDRVYLAQPYVTNPVGGAAPSTSIKELLGVAQASVKKFSGIALASIKKVSGVSNVS